MNPGEVVKLFACGDVVNFDKSDGHICANDLSDFIASHDLGVCNFEAPVSGFGTPQPKSGGHMSQPPETLKGLKDQGFNVLLLANNHIMDFGRDGLSATMSMARGGGLDTVGAGLNPEQAYAPLIRNIGGLRLGLINACEAQFGVLDFYSGPETAGYAWVNHPRIDRLILRLAQECDFVILFSHAGLENYEIPQREWRERYRHFCDLGVDVVIGTHPHLPQGYERYRRSVIFYSLGNFFLQKSARRNMLDASYAVSLELRRDGISFDVVPHATHGAVVGFAAPDERVDVDRLCAMLDADYDALHEHMSALAYDKLRRRLGNSFSMRRSALDALKMAIKRWRSGRAEDLDLTRLHLMRNEAYYYAIRHALAAKAKGKD